MSNFYEKLHHYSENLLSYNYKWKPVTGNAIRKSAIK